MYVPISNVSAYCAQDRIINNRWKLLFQMIDTSMIMNYALVNLCWKQIYPPPLFIWKNQGNCEHFYNC